MHDKDRSVHEGSKGERLEAAVESQEDFRVAVLLDNLTQEAIHFIDLRGLVVSAVQEHCTRVGHDTGQEEGNHLQ